MSRNGTDIHDHRDDLERAVAEVLAEPLDDSWVEEAAARVWKNLAGAGALGFAPGDTGAADDAGAQGVRLQGCREQGQQIPAFLRGELAPARAMLFADHLRDCLPCRRVVHLARQERAGRATSALHEVVEGATGGRGRLASRRVAASWSGWSGRPAESSRRPRRSRRLLLATAAAVLLVGTGLGLALFRTLGSGAAGAPGVRMARVEAVDGGLYRVAGPSSLPVATGDAVHEGERVRTAKGSRAVLRMNDGSRIEMAERAGLALAAGRGGNTIDLERGLIIVQAARQRPHHLYVATADCLVSVTGTIFAVNHGTRGSRVSVIEGEVHVGPQDLVLHAGGQATTRANVEAVPVREEVAWSRDAPRYDALLAELSAAGSAIDAQVVRPAPRSSSRLLDLVPAGSLVYVALPNLSASLSQTQQLLEQRLAGSPVLQGWWSQTLGSPANQQLFHELVQEVADLGRYLGDEVVVAAGAAPAAGTPATPADTAGSGPPVLLAEVTQEAQLRATLQQEVATVNRRAGKTVLVLLDQLPQPAPAPAAGSAPSTVQVWVGQGVLVASPSASQIAAVAANLQPGAVNGFVASSFHARLAQAYADGAGSLFGADLKQLMAGLAKRHAAAPASPASPASSGLTDAMGLFDLEHFVLERHDEAAGAAASTETRAAVTFSQPRRGIASWLAAPAPMGSLAFFSGDASLVAAFVVKSPVELLDELLSLSPDLAATLAKAEAEHGFDLRADLAAPLGGEIALGLDGPLLPSPAWQLVAEVYDPVRLQQTFARAVQQANAGRVAAGKPGVQLQQQEDGGRTYYSITSSQPPVELHYLFVDGYLVAAPTRAQLDRALSERAAGTTLAASARLRGLLGRDGQVNVSALFYQNLAPLADLASGVAPGGSQGFFSNPLLGGGHGPALLYAYAEADRIVFAGHTEAGPAGLNLGTLTGFGAILGGMERAHDAAKLGTPTALAAPNPARGPKTARASRAARRSGSGF